MGKRLEKLLERKKRVQDAAREGMAFCQYHDRYISIFEIDYKHCYQSRKYEHGFCPYLRFTIKVEPK
jgi:hypothetical protein